MFLQEVVIHSRYLLDLMEPLRNRSSWILYNSSFKIRNRVGKSSVGDRRSLSSLGRTKALAACLELLFRLLTGILDRQHFVRDSCKAWSVSPGWCGLVRGGYFSVKVPLFRFTDAWQFGHSADPEWTKRCSAGQLDNPAWLPPGKDHRRNDKGSVTIS